MRVRKLAHRSLSIAVTETLESRRLLTADCGCPDVTTHAIDPRTPKTADSIFEGKIIVDMKTGFWAPPLAKEFGLTVDVKFAADNTITRWNVPANTPNPEQLVKKIAASPEVEGAYVVWGAKKTTAPVTVTGLASGRLAVQVRVGANMTLVADMEWGGQTINALAGSWRVTLSNVTDTASAQTALNAAGLKGYTVGAAAGSTGTFLLSAPFSLLPSTVVSDLSKVNGFKAVVPVLADSRTSTFSPTRTIRNVFDSPLPDTQDGWQVLPSLPNLPGKTAELSLTRANALSLDPASIRATLAQAPQEFTTGVDGALTIKLPTPTGRWDTFAVWDSPIMEKGLADQFPDFKTYVGQSLDNPTETLRLSLTALGLQAQVLGSTTGSWYIDPYFHLDQSAYVSYYKHDMNAPTQQWVSNSLEADGTDSNATSDLGGGTVNAQPAIAGTLRTYRLAVACTGEYAAYFGGTVTNAMSAIVAAVNRVTGVYETELDIRLNLVANNASIVYTNSATDPYTNNNGSTMLGQNQTNVDSVIGTANYDIGHVFSTGGGGVAYLGVVGKAGSKAGGVTGSSAPTNDAFWIDYVAHEMGHQFGGNHTFNSQTGSCSGGNRNASTAYEVGSGSTIMAYAGICGTDDLQPHSDPYFSFISFQEIVAYTTTAGSAGNTSAVQTSTGNNAPTVSAGSNYTIPANTPFVLTATGSDPDGNTVTYGWEERDTGAALALSGGDNGASPLFRSYNPTTDPTRTFPRLSKILANSTAIDGEVLPTTSRSLKFRVTARDNRAGGGGVNQADMTVTTVNTAAAFALTSQNTAVTYAGGSTQNITWNVAGTTANGINVANVKISLSIDGGNTYAYVLVPSVANSGTAAVQMPYGLSTTQGRFKVEAVGNIFFDVNNANTTITLVSQLGTASGKAYQDWLSDGVFNGSDIATSGATIFSDANNNNVLDGGELSTTTDASGNWTLSNIPVGSANIKAVTPSGLIYTGPSGGYTITSSGGSSSPGLNFAFFPTTISGTAGADAYVVTLSASSTVQFTRGATLTHEIALARVNQPLTLSTGNGSDTVNIDLANGSPISASGLTVNGGLATDAISFTGSSTADSITVNGSTYTVAGGGGGTISTTLVESASINLGSGDDTITYATVPALPTSLANAGGTDTLALTGGSHTFATDLATFGRFALSVTGSASATLSSAQTLAGLTIGAGNLVNVPLNGNRAITTEALSIAATGALDLNDNDLIVRNGDIAAVTALVSSGLNLDAAGYWDGNGIRSGWAAADSAFNRYALGTALNNFGGDPLLTTLDGVTLGLNDVIVKATYFGDADLSGTVTDTDYFLINDSLTSGQTGWVNGDFDYSGGLSDTDFFLLNNAYTNAGGPL